MSAASHHDAAVLRQSFAKYDADGSGSIDVRELRALMHDVTGEEPTDEETTAFSRAVDIDGDGALSFDEFKAIYTKVKSGELAFGGLQLAMDAFDTLVAWFFVLSAIFHAFPVFVGPFDRYAWLYWKQIDEAFCPWRCAAVRVTPPTTH